MRIGMGLLGPGGSPVVESMKCQPRRLEAWDLILRSRGSLEADKQGIT